MNKIIMHILTVVFLISGTSLSTKTKDTSDSVDDSFDVTLFIGNPGVGKTTFHYEKNTTGDIKTDRDIEYDVTRLMQLFFGRKLPSEMKM